MVIEKFREGTVPLNGAPCRWFGKLYGPRGGLRDN